MNQPTAANSNIRHSFNGSEVDLNFSGSPPSIPNHSSFGLSAVENGTSQGRVNGHSRSGSAGNWGSFSRSAHLSMSPYPHSSSPAGDKMTSPWSTSELAVGSSRLNEKAWA